MKSHTAGWTLLVAATGMMSGLIGAELLSVEDWQYVSTTAFVGKTLIHVASVTAAFVGGKLIPTKGELD